MALFMWAGSRPTSQEKFEATLARLKSEGFAVDADNLWTDCPEDENAWPLWKELFPPKASATSGTMTAGTSPPRMSAHPRREDPNRLLRDLMVDRTALSESEKAKLRDYFSATSDTLAQFETIASRSCFSIPDNRNRDLWEWETPRLSGVSKQFRIQLIERGLLDLDDGHPGEALRLAIVSLRFSRIPIQSPSFLNSMFGLALRRYSVGLLREILQDSVVDEETGREAMALLDFSEFKEGFLRGFDRERLMVLQMSKRSFAREGEFGESTDFVSRKLLEMESADIQNAWAEILRAARKPYWEGKADLDRIDRALGGRSLFAFYEKAFVRDSFPERFEKLAELEARSEMLRLGIACQLRARLTGSLPDTLEDLVPEFFSSLPLDPYTGRPFLYEKLPDGGFRIASAGPNGIDETSTPVAPAMQPASSSVQPSQGDDVVFECAAP